MRDKWYHYVYDDIVLLLLFEIITKQSFVSLLFGSIFLFDVINYSILLLFVVVMQKNIISF